MEDVCEEYRSSLEDLSCNSKPLINMLTMLAEDNASYAPKIVQVIETHLQKVSGDVKLPVMYLIDSIIKNVGGPYLQLFTQNIVSDFCAVFEKVDEKTRVQLFKLRQTWSEVFPAKKMYAIDVRVRSIDPAWPITAPKPANIHFNPKFLDNKTPAPVQAPVVVRPPAVDQQQQAEIRDQVMKKQQELLKLKQQRLELELLQAKVKLEEQSRSKPPQCLPLVNPLLPFLPALDPRITRRNASLRDPRIHKMIPPTIPSKVVQPLVPQVQMPSKVVPPLVVQSSRLETRKPAVPSKRDTTLTEGILPKNDTSNNLPKRDMQTLNNLPPKCDENSLPVNKPPKSDNKGSTNSKVSSPDVSAPKISPTKIIPSKKLDASKNQSTVNSNRTPPRLEKNIPKSKTADPMIIDLTEDDVKIDKSKDAKSLPSKKPQPKSSPKTYRGKSRKKNVSPEKHFTDGDKHKHSSSDLIKHVDNDPDKHATNDTEKKDSKKDDRTSEKRSDSKSDKKSRKSRDRSPTKSRSRSPPSRKSKDKKKKVEDSDVDLRFEIHEEEEPVNKKAKLDDIDSLFGGKDQDYRLPPTNSSDSPPTPSHKDKWGSPDKDKKNSWAQYKASHPDEYKSPMRRDSAQENFQDQDMRFNKSGRSERDFDRLGRPLLSRMKIDRLRSDSFGDSSINLMLNKQEEILHEAEVHLRAGLISPVEFQNLQAKLRRLREMHIQEEENRKALAGVRIPPSKPIFLDGKMREISFLGRRAIVQMDGGSYHQLGFAGAPTRVFLDEREIFRLGFNGECREFTTAAGNTHTVMFGAPSREVYVDGVPYEATFGGPAVTVLLDGQRHRLRLDGPQPSVELTDQPVRGLPLGRLPNEDRDFRCEENRLDIDMRLRGSPQQMRNSPPRRNSPHRRNSPMPWRENPDEQLWRNEQMDWKDGRQPMMDARPLLENRPLIDQPINNRQPNIDPHFFNEAPWKNNDWDWRGNQMGMGSQPMSRLQRQPLRPDMDAMRPPDMNSMRPEMNLMRPDMNSLRSDMNPMRPDMDMRPDANAMRPEMNVMGIECNVINQEINQMRPPMLGHPPGMPFGPMGGFQQRFGAPFRRVGLLGNQPPNNSASSSQLSQSQEEVPARGENPLDVSSLLAKLVSSGLIKTEQAALKKDEEDEEDIPIVEEKVPAIDLSLESLKARYPGVVGVLYRGTQCASCGMRFKEAQQDKYSQHLDWHFRANRREKDGVKKAFSRKWFYDVEDWIQFEEIEDLEDRARSFFELQAGQESFPTDQTPARVPSVPASQDQSENMCVVCSEPFQLFWVEEEEEWHLRGAIRKEGKTYHPLCYDDFAKVPETPTDEATDAEKSLTQEKEPEESEEMETDVKEGEENADKEEAAETEPAEESATEETEKMDVEGKENSEKEEEASEEETKKEDEEAKDEEPKETDNVEEPSEEVEEEIRECDKAPAIEEEIIGLIDEEEGEEKVVEESQMVVLPAAGTGKIVMKVKADSIAVERPATPVQDEKDKPDVKEEEEAEEYSELEAPAEPGFTVLDPIEKGKELSGLCSIM